MHVLNRVLLVVVEWAVSLLMLCLHRLARLKLLNVLLVLNLTCIGLAWQCSSLALLLLVASRMTRCMQLVLYDLGWFDSRILMFLMPVVIVATMR